MNVRAFISGGFILACVSLWIVDSEGRRTVSKDVTLQDGDHFQGLLEADDVLIPQGATVWVDNDLLIHASGNVSIEGTLRAIDRGDDESKAAPGIAIVAQSTIDITGSVLGGRGKSYPQTIECTGIEGGRGSDLLMRAPVINVNGIVRAGSGGHGGAGAKAGDGGSAQLFGLTLSRDASAQNGVYGGAGGDGLNWNALTGVAAAGGDGGEVFLGSFNLESPLTQRFTKLIRPKLGPRLAGMLPIQITLPLDSTDMFDLPPGTSGWPGNSDDQSGYMPPPAPGGSSGTFGYGNGGPGGNGATGSDAKGGKGGNGGPGANCCPNCASPGGQGGRGGLATAGHGQNAGNGGDAYYDPLFGYTGHGGNGGSGGRSGNATGGTGGDGGPGGVGNGKGGPAGRGGLGIAIGLGGSNGTGGLGNPIGMDGQSGWGGRGLYGNPGKTGEPGPPCPTDDDD